MPAGPFRGARRGAWRRLCHHRQRSRGLHYSPRIPQVGPATPITIVTADGGEAYAVQFLWTEENTRESGAKTFRRGTKGTWRKHALWRSSQTRLL